MALRYEEFLAAGTRIVAIDVDSPTQHSAMVEKLSLPFPFLSDPDRTGAITPLGLANPSDPRDLAIPAIVLVDPTGTERWRWVSRDFADRIPEDEVVAVVTTLALGPVAAEPIEVAAAEPGPSAVRLDTLADYYRGAKFASMAMYLRMRQFPEAKDAAKAESVAFAEEMDRYIAALRTLRD